MRDRTVGRRRFLAWAAGLAAGGVAAGCSAPAAAPGPQATPPLRLPAPEIWPPAEPAPQITPENTPTTITELVYSEFRQASVGLTVTYPSGVTNTENLPMVLSLHGRDGPVPTATPFGTLAAMESEYQAGTIPAFGFVSVDGGYNAYWNNGSLNGELMSMIQDEIPRWLLERGLGEAGTGLPYACVGLSTGGFGAACYAIERNRRGIPLEAVGLLAPALMTDWKEVEVRQAFPSEQVWRSHDPLLRLDELGDVPVAVWIGDKDHFFDGTMQLVAGHENTPVVTILPGAHDGSVFDATGLEAVHFLSRDKPVEG
ncbi:alpha/beta hydrolase-fold protein [Allosaccharopolyspora coralli]|uniref:alpha/beta hydrolase-fold protein n=1 Tax=Allosaccharopolyspora coralli TaxID=2665642 RepID=UPI0016521D26|nr:alpha/beta hydrolase-fold protein [Allosaccharopolyspora coralli]